MIKLPDIPQVGTVNRNITSVKLSNHKSPRVQSADNPFHMPTEEEVFRMKEEEISNRKEAKETAKKLKIYEKGVKRRRNFKELLTVDDPEEAALIQQLKTKKESDKVLVSQQMNDRHLGRDNLQDFVSKKREMFLLQYALGVKKDEICKLEDIALGEEQKLLDDEKSLEEDAAKFDAFLKENDKNSVEAIKRAEAETKAKLERISEIKKLNIQIMSVRSDMSKNEDQLKDYQRYRQFLEKLTPVEWLQAQQKTKKTKESGRKVETDIESVGAQKSVAPKGKLQSKQSKVQFNKKVSVVNTMVHTATEEEGEAGDGLSENYYSDDDEPFSLFFSTPQELLEIFSELEENNLALIQNCQETEETLEELRGKIAETDSRMVKETESLRGQISFLEQAIEREEDKARMLEEKSKMSIVSLNENDQEILLAELNAKVKEVYRRCIGDAETNISTLQMLTSIENRLESLFGLIEVMPPEKVEKAERMKDKERRQRAREEKLDAQRAIQEERIQRALERARAPVKKKTGKSVVFRSAPPQKKKMKEEDNKNKEEEDLAYYWE